MKEKILAKLVWFKNRLNHSLPYLILHIDPINFNFNSCNFVKKVKYDFDLLWDINHYMISVLSAVLSEKAISSKKYQK